MKVLIVEDEPKAAERLSAMLKTLDPSIEIIKTLETVEETVAYLEENMHPQLAFFDIQLADDMSFKIFDKTDVRFPIIFTTAFDQYLLQALEHNSIDYLLKPIQPDRLEKALQKIKRLETHFVQHKFHELFNQNLNESHEKKRFLVKKGTDFVSVSIKQIAYFFTEHKLSFLIDRNGNKYIIDKTITDLDDELNAKYFFRANRKYLVHIDAIAKFKSNNGKILLSLMPETTEEVTVSKETAPLFRDWIESH